MTKCGCKCEPVKAQETEKCCDKGKKPMDCTPEQVKACHGESKPS